MSLYVYIGRFQIPHFGHASVMKHALEKGDKVLILIGSANTERSRKNPFSFEERREMVEGVIAGLKEKTGRDIPVDILPLNDFESDQAWVDEVKRLVPQEADTFITGCRKSGDESTFYLSLFPEWKEDFIFEVNVEGMDVISSTKVRELFYKGEAIPDVIAPSTKGFLERFRVGNGDILASLS
ncbi:adenylyltransferase/cytidyltransferase family protein [Serratia sp. Se-RSBMAAmG]|uniref:adenylyltransferase/cytidyltransferase family protein n=1 Tax=Serratia sp. Se-RSBMAAmG TaxID=3043305 RepID=UPI0024AFA09B|nr:adenylyltransferase/cytidyltransferase family protein [Serratia sp. Se-RSBMAAmG]MDI6977129.1 adenylyltransferase/cytidyltransferase family protein [Serratia sp. Se-RSBMAAmG]